MKDTPFPEENWVLEDYVLYLQRVPESAKEMKFPILSEGITARVVNYTAKIQKTENQLINALEEKSYRLSLLKSFKNTSSEYELAMHHQQARLEPINNGWLASKLEKLNSCPVCGSDNDDAKENAEALISSAKSIHDKISQVRDSKDILDKEVMELEKEISELEKQLNSIRIQLETLGREHDKIERQRKTIEDIYRYVGRIEQNLKNLSEIKIESTLLERISKLDNEIRIIQKQLSTTNNQQNRDSVMKRISQSIVAYKEILKVEDADNPTEIDERQLTLKITSKDSRSDYLWEIGSGSNWMGYHVATLLALHEFFLTLKPESHVPTFIIFDQPSQAYFPESIKNNEDAQKNRNSDDLERVKAIFQAFSKFYDKTNLQCQIIVLEHASPEFWNDVQHTHYVGNKRWTKYDALIPETWLS